MTVRSAYPTNTPYRLAVRADLSQLAAARQWLGDIALAASFPESRVFDLQVATSEAIANGIEHASSEVEILVWTLPDRLLVEVTNDGVFQPGLFKDNDQRRRGLGLPLMASLADQIHLSRLADGRTKVSLTFFRERPQDAVEQAVEEGAGSVEEAGGLASVSVPPTPRNRNVATEHGSRNDVVAPPHTTVHHPRRRAAARRPADASRVRRSAHRLQHSVRFGRRSRSGLFRRLVVPARRVGLGSAAGLRRGLVGTGLPPRRPADHRYQHLRDHPQHRSAGGGWPLHCLGRLGPPALHHGGAADGSPPSAGRIPRPRRCRPGGGATRGEQSCSHVSS